MNIPTLINRINSVYGYRAIGTIRVVQTHGSTEQNGQEHASDEIPVASASSEIADAVAAVKDEELRHLLEELGNSVVASVRSKKGGLQE